MDFRHYRGDLPELPDWITPHLHLFRYVGVFLVCTTPLIRWLAVLQIIPRYSWWYLLGVINYPLGLSLFFIGYIFNTSADRNK